MMVSLSNKPSTLPGLYQLGIGNNFSELILLLYLRQDTSGSSTVQFVYPKSVPSGTQIYFQAMSVDSSTPRLPYPTTNVLPVKIL